MNHTALSRADYQIRDRHWRLAREFVDDAGIRTAVMMVAQIAQERLQDAIRKGGEGPHLRQLRRIAADMRVIVRDEGLE